MKKYFMLTISVLCLTAQAQKISLDEADRKAQETLKQMTLDEKLRLIEGNSFDIQPIERLGIKKVHMYDGPIGVRGTKPDNAAYPSNGLSRLGDAGRYMEPRTGTRLRLCPRS